MSSLGKIFIVDDNEDILFALHLLLSPLTEQVKVATSPDRIEHFMNTFDPDLILLDMNFGRDVVTGQEGFDTLARILKIDPQAVVVFMTAYSDTEKAVAAIKAGAFDFVSKPWEGEKLLATLSAGMKLRRSTRQVERLQQQIDTLNGETADTPIIGQSPAMMELFSLVEKLSQTEANLLITGENGTGKDLLARMLYRQSPRSEMPFVTIDLGSIPETLFESELFGYEKGAFTDARKPKAGRMEVASGGTLFLDEIGNLSLPMQSKLLTAIEKRQITRLGSTRSTAIDVRLICATNADLRTMVSEGLFRQDLLYRINTVELSVPPLREREDDILLLADFFLDRYQTKYRKAYRGISREAHNRLLRYSWPGNVRELQHAIERAVILGNGTQLTPDDFPSDPSVAIKESHDLLNLEELERQAIEKALKSCRGNVSRAAELLGITRFSLYRKMEKLEL